MKKLIICVLTLFVLVPLAPFAASADYVPNTTEVMPYQNGGFSNYYGVPWVDNIPKGNSDFKIYGYDIAKFANSDVALNIFTNMPLGGDPSTNPVPPIPCPVGDLFLYLGDNYNPSGAFNGFTQALVLPPAVNGGTATLLDINAVTTTAGTGWPGTGWIYTGKYRTSTADTVGMDPPVKATGTETHIYDNGAANPTFTDITATWSLNPTTNPGKWELSILFPGLDGNNSNDMVFLWASGNCANGVIFGDYQQPISPPHVPVPPSALLLGTGLLGLGILRYRRKGR